MADAPEVKPRQKLLAERDTEIVNAIAVKVNEAAPPISIIYCRRVIAAFYEMHPLTRAMAHMYLQKRGNEHWENVAHQKLRESVLYLLAYKSPVIPNPERVKDLELLRAILVEFDKVTRSDALEYKGMAADRALYLMLEKHIDELPSYDDRFIKMFRQCDITDCGKSDMVIYHLLNQSEKFWKVADKVKKRIATALAEDTDDDDTQADDAVEPA